MADQTRTFDPAASKSAPKRATKTAPGGISDKPEEDWGEPADEGAAYSANHLNRTAKAGAKVSQGRKTRAATKDQFSRRT